MGERALAPPGGRPRTPAPSAAAGGRRQPAAPPPRVLHEQRATERAARRAVDALARRGRHVSLAGSGPRPALRRKWRLGSAETCGGGWIRPRPPHALRTGECGRQRGREEGESRGGGGARRRRGRGGDCGLGLEDRRENGGGRASRGRPRGLGTGTGPSRTESQSR